MKTTKEAFLATLDFWEWSAKTGKEKIKRGFIDGNTSKNEGGSVEPCHGR